MFVSPLTSSKPGIGQLWPKFFLALLAGFLGTACDHLLKIPSLAVYEFSFAIGVGIALAILWGPVLGGVALGFASGIFHALLQQSSPSVLVGASLFTVLGVCIPALSFQSVMQNPKYSGENCFLLACGSSAITAAGIQGLGEMLSHVWLPGTASYGVLRDSFLAWTLQGMLSVLLVTSLVLRVHPSFHESCWSFQKCARTLWLSLLLLLFAYSTINLYYGLIFACFASFLVALASVRERQLGSLCFSLAMVGLAMHVSRTAENHVLVRANALQTLIQIQLFSLLLIATTLTVQGLKNLGELRLPAIAFLGGWIVQFMVAVGFYKAETALNEERFESYIRENILRIEARFKTYTDGLQGAAALLKTLGDRMQPMEPRHWRSFVDAMELEKHYPGIRGVALIRRISQEKFPEFLESARRIIPEFQVRDIPSVTERPLGNELFVVANIEPFEKNRLALGINLASEENRKEAAERAAATYRPAVTKRIMLVQDSQKKAGLLYYLPVYDNGQNTGWVNVPLTTDEFFRSVTYVGTKEVGFTAHFAGDESFTLYSSFQLEEAMTRLPHKTLTLELAQQPFVFHWYRLAGYSNAHDTAASWVSFAIGSLTLLLAVFLANMQMVRKRAERLAEEIASDRDHHRSMAFHAAKMSLVGEMAGGIAHEINNPLAVIALSTQQVHRTLAAREAEDPTLKKLEKISQTVQRITKIVQGLRAFSRSGDKLPPAEVTLETMVTGVLDLCRERFYHHNIEIQVDDIPDLKLRVVAVQIEQVLMNLMSNAFDAIEGSEKPWVHISFGLYAEHLEIRVTDSGAGIPEEIRERLMQPFFTTKEIGKGTGLGLSISKGIMESHQGNLSLDPQIAHTCFVMRLPLTAKSHQPQAV